MPLAERALLRRIRRFIPADADVIAIDVGMGDPIGRGDSALPVVLTTDGLLLVTSVRGTAVVTSVPFAALVCADASSEKLLALDWVHESTGVLRSTVVDFRAHGEKDAFLDEVFLQLANSDVARWALGEPALYPRDDGNGLNASSRRYRADWMFVPLPQVPLLGVLRAPDLRVWELYREVVDSAILYVEGRVASVPLVAELEWFAREFVSAIWDTDGVAAAADRLGGVRLSVRAATAAGVAFAEVEDMRRPCPSQAASLAHLCALDFGCAVLSGGISGPLLAACAHAMRAAYYMAKLPDLKAEDALPSPIQETGSYLSGSRFESACHAIVEVWDRGQ